MTEPEQWAVELFKQLEQMVFISPKGAGLDGEAFYAIQRAFEERERELREAVQNIERICRENVRETDEPDRVKWDGVWHEGPLATAYIQTLQAFGELARQALATRQDAPVTENSHDQ